MWRLRVLDGAARQLAALDRLVSRRIVSRLSWLESNVDKIRAVPLKGDLSNFYKFRVGDYRVIYQLVHDESTIIVHEVGHRSDIYRKR
jgi:mRNA interferase RelE/StbE